MAPRGPVIKRIEELRRHVSLVRIAKDTGIPISTIQNWFTKEHKGEGKWVHRTYYDRIMAYELPLGIMTPDERIRGAQRIYRGLAVRGFTAQIICESLDISAGALKNVVCDGAKTHHTISPDTYDELVKVACKLETQDPHDLIPGKGPNVIRGKARAQGWIDIGAWDLDTVHRADALPDATGLCGRLTGALIHLREGQPLCAACQARADNPRNVVDIYKLYGVHKLGKSHVESAQLLGIDKDLYSQYAQYLRREERRTHALSSLDKLALTAYCDFCRETVKLYRHNASKFVCSNAVKDYRKEKGL
jgi:hypothetical protein